MTNWKRMSRKFRINKVQVFNCETKHCSDKSGFVRVMENLESHGILEFHFPGLESHLI